MTFFLRGPTKRKQLLLMAADSLIVLATLVAAVAIRVFILDRHGWPSFWVRLYPFATVPLVVYSTTFYILELYGAERRWTKAVLLFRITAAVFVGVGLVAIVVFFFPSVRYGRVLMLTHAAFLIVALFGWRLAFQRWLVAAQPVQKILLIGNGSVAEYVGGLVEQAPMLELKVDATLEPDAAESPKELVARIRQIIAERGIEIVVVAEKSVDRLVESELLELKIEGLRVCDVTTLTALVSGRVPVLHTDASDILYTFDERAFASPFTRKSKRALDLFVAGAILLVTLPVTLLVAILVKATSHGPVLFRQERLGRNQEPFVLVKFRTMLEDPDPDKPRWAEKDADRITPIGRLLRKTRLDELPQLLNVLQGDMSFVGPRPIRKHFADQLAAKIPYYRLRFTVKPGITGWAQVRSGYGASEEGQLEKLEYELFYIFNQSVLFDLFIVLKTVQTVIFRHGE